MSKKALGRGLEHLFEQSSNLENETSTNQKIENIDISDIKPNPYQPRKTFDEKSLQELADSIKINGIFQPILVRKNIIGYEIISGERRYRASKLAKLKEIPAIIYDYDDQKMMEVALVENIQREDLNIVEEAKSYQTLMEKLNYTQEKLSEVIGKSRSHVANVLRICTLNDEIIGALEKEKISFGHAKVLLGIKDKQMQKEIFTEILNDNLNIRETENLIKSYSTSEKKVQSEKVAPKSKRTSSGTSSYRRLEEIMREKLETKIEISGSTNGQIKIDYSSSDDLERLLELLKIL